MHALVSAVQWVAEQQPQQIVFQVDLQHNQANVLGVTCLTLGVAFDWLGIGRDAWADRCAAAFVLVGVQKLTHGGQFMDSLRLLETMFGVNASWAVTISNLIGVLMVTIAVGCFLPESSSSTWAGRIARRTWTGKRVIRGRINPRVYVIPACIGAFPATGGFIGVVLGIIIGIATAVCTAVAMFLTGLV